MSAPRIPNNIEYWLKKGKLGKEVVIHTHDDCDGIFSAIVMKNYLLKNGFKITAYNVVNYQEGWTTTFIDTKYINIAVDFSEDHPSIDVYIDHHGNPFDETNKKYSAKKKTGSAYELICRQLGVPTDSLILEVIDMIDSAKYDFYEVDVKLVLKDYKQLSRLIIDSNEYKKARLILAASINQMIKRSDHKSLIEVIHNTTDCSIYSLLHQYMHYYPKNNLDFKTKTPKNCFDDYKNRMSIMHTKTQGNTDERKIYNNYNAFIADYNLKNIKGYFIVGNIAFIRTGSWANPVRARAIIENDYLKGLISKKVKIKFIILQYGSTLQVCDYAASMSKSKYLIKTKNGTKINDLGQYTDYLLQNFEESESLKYYNIKTKAGSDGSEGSVTGSGGHAGIGTISNIVGRCEVEGSFFNMKFIDLLKNKMIIDLGGKKVKWNLCVNWYYDMDDEQEYLMRLLKKHNIITIFEENKYLSYPIRELKKMLELNNIRYKKEVEIEINKRYMDVSSIRKTQKI